MSSYYQKINTLYKRDMTKPKKPIILGEYSEPEFEVLKDLKWEATEKIDGTNSSWSLFLLLPLLGFSPMTISLYTC